MAAASSSSSDPIDTNRLGRDRISDSSSGNGTVVPIKGSTIVSNLAGWAVATRIQSLSRRKLSSSCRQV